MLSIAIFLLFLLLFTALAELSPAKPINLSRASRSTVFHHNLGIVNIEVANIVVQRRFERLWE
jgi:hypothetical protein